MSYDIILFDADDTLFDFYHTGQKSFLKACKTLGIPAEEKDYDIYSNINQKRWDLYSLGKLTRHDVVIGRFEEYAQVKNISFDIEKFYETYENNLAGTSILMAETPALLYEVKQRGKRCFMITNGLKAVQRGRLALSGIAHYFEDVFISDEIGFKKPSKEYFDYVATHIPNFEKEKSLIVGDSIVSDIALGINNCVATCHFNPNNLPYSDNLIPTYKIEKLTDLLNII
ncbi:MAG: YjjG family noncanonical pyrimidine nucleotidase [Clostridiales bacterium]|nr:YjjG family noncanonical pyrimidine nucleotidase [Clostridiales bacterium]MDY2900879.1 YjjG family noncanonical pyrimidine nucleotidase [Christensenellaceae bacterium]